MRGGEFVEEILRNHTAAREGHELPRLFYDECANHPVVLASGSAALRGGLVAAVIPAWYQHREKADGSRLMFKGSSRSGRTSQVVEYGLPVKGASWSDEMVVQEVVANWAGTDRLILVSANTRRDADGLRSVLTNEVRPVLDRLHADRFGLLVLLKKGKTRWPVLGAALSEALAREVPVGFSLRLV